MLNDLFYAMRDVKNEYKETEVTANKIGPVVEQVGVKQSNIRVDVEGLTGDATLSIRFEESENGTDFNEIGTFPIPDAHHGIVFAKFKPYVRYTLLVGGTDPKLNVNVWF